MNPFWLGFLVGVLLTAAVFLMAVEPHYPKQDR